MEISGPAITGALRIGLHIVSSHKRPMLEFYHQVHNRFGPENIHEMPSGLHGEKTRTVRYRAQDIFIQFFLANIGGERAQNIKLKISGDLKRNEPREDFGGLFRTIIPQMGPGQIYYLFNFNQFDIMFYPSGENSPTGLKKQSLTLTAEYEAPNSFLNTLIAFFTKLKKTRRFVTTYTFSPQLVEGDLPPAEYA